PSSQSELACFTTSLPSDENPIPTTTCPKGGYFFCLLTIHTSGWFLRTHTAKSEWYATPSQSDCLSVLVSCVPRRISRDGGVPSFPLFSSPDVVFLSFWLSGAGGVQGEWVSTPSMRGRRTEMCCDLRHGTSLFGDGGSSFA
ncbi:unnamed protein product, partial [Ectocarpus sp. 4 AP-2014]